MWEGYMGKQNSSKSGGGKKTVKIRRGSKDSKKTVKRTVN
jgi:hypothetical protein